MTDKNEGHQEMVQISDQELDAASGGIGYIQPGISFAFAVFAESDSNEERPLNSNGNTQISTPTEKDDVVQVR